MDSAQPACHYSGETLRSLSEVITKSVLLRFVTCFIMGHLYSLRRRERRKHGPAVFEIVTFLLLPALPLAQLCRRFIAVTVIIWKEGRNSGDIRYLLCAAMDMQAVLGENPNDEDAKTMPLTELKLDYLTPHDMPYDWTWLGRLISILSILGQAICTLILWKNRHYRNALWQLDNRNVLVAIGGLVAASTSLIIHLCNRKYTWDNPKQADYNRYHERVSRYWAPQLLLESEHIPEFVWNFRTSLFWDIEITAIVTHLLKGLVNHPYSQMNGFFGYSEAERRSEITLGRQTFMFFDLVWIANCWIPLAHSLLHSLRPERKFWRNLESFLFLLRTMWVGMEFMELVGVDLFAAIIELASLSRCPRACTAIEMELFWKDPLENKLFLF